jgi:hypothetical protein
MLGRLVTDELEGILKEAALAFRHFSGVTEEYLQNTRLERYQYNSLLRSSFKTTHRI